MSDVPAQLLEKTAFNCFPPSIRLQVEIVQSPRKVVEDKLSEGTILQEYAATSSGRRFLDRQSHRRDHANHETFYSDGTKCPMSYMIEAISPIKRVSRSIIYSAPRNSLALWRLRLRFATTTSA